MNLKEVPFSLDEISPDKKFDLYLAAQQQDLKILKFKLLVSRLEDGITLVVSFLTVLILFSASINKAMTDWYQGISWLQPVEGFVASSQSDLKSEASKEIISPIKDVTIADAFKSCDKTDASICVSSEQGGREHPISGETHQHNGVDIAAPSGTPVVATESGVVSKVWNQEGLGGLIVEFVPNSNKNLTIKHLHLSEQSVKEGQKVSKGDILGKVGSTGGSTGDHLDIRIWNEETNSWENVRVYFKVGS